MSVVEKYVDAFRANSVKITPQRLGIFKILDGNTSHPSAEDIYNDLKREHPTVSFATVYNTLDKLYELNLLLKLNIEDEKKHFDPDTSQHHHFLCKKCKSIIDIFEDVDVSLSSETKSKIKIDGYHIYFYGVCNDCKE